MAKKKTTRRRTITRQDIRRPEDTGENLSDVEKRWEVGPRTTATHGGAEVHLKRASVRVAARAFQWRKFGPNWIPSDDHIFVMARAVREGAKPLTPILVLPVASWFYVIDGHHRLAAYDTAGWRKGIPARVFEGSAQDAYREALKLNSRTQLPMTRADKLNAAWTLVKNDDPRDSIADTMQLSGASKGTVNSMRAVWKKLIDGTHGERDDVVTLSWAQARNTADGRPDLKELDDWREAEADKIIEKLHRARLIGDLTKYPDITALVIAKLDDGLPALLTAEWSEGIEKPFDPHEAADEDLAF